MFIALPQLKTSLFASFPLCLRPFHVQPDVDSPPQIDVDSLASAKFCLVMLRHALLCLRLVPVAKSDLLR